MWVADVAHARAEGARSVGKNEYFSGAPDLVIEVLSPSNTAIEINDKRSICLANGCSSFWVVDPKAKQVSVTEDRVTHHYDLDDSISCSLIAEVIPVREIFE